MSPDPDKPVSVVSCQNVAEADVLKIALEEAGIESTIDGATLNTAFALPLTGHAIGGVRLIVRQRDAEDALKVIQRTRDSWTAPRQDPWFCGQCLEEVDGGFEICWSCGKSRSEVEGEFPATADRVEVLEIPVVQTDSLGRETENPYESPRAMGVADEEEIEQDPDEALAESRVMLGLAISAASFMLPIFPALAAWYIFYSVFRKRMPLSSRARTAFWFAILLITVSHLFWLWIWVSPVWSFQGFRE